MHLALRDEFCATKLHGTPRKQDIQSFRPPRHPIGREGPIDVGDGIFLGAVTLHMRLCTLGCGRSERGLPRCHVAFALGSLPFCATDTAACMHKSNIHIICGLLDGSATSRTHGQTRRQMCCESILLNLRHVQKMSQHCRHSRCPQYRLMYMQLCILHSKKRKTGNVTVP